MAEYGANLAPDLTSRFPHVFSRPMSHSMGHNVPSDWGDKADDDPVFGIYKRCGCWTSTERELLFAIASQVKGQWLDLGSHTCLTTVYMAAAGCDVIAVDNMYRVPEFEQRARLNVEAVSDVLGDVRIELFGCTSDEFFAGRHGRTFVGVSVDADHCHPHPLHDAMNADRCLADDGVILFHDFWGAPVYEAARALMDMGYKCRVYSTPHGVGLLWRGDKFVPPDHSPDPSINWARIKQSMKGFPHHQCV